jgi:hypothetical protein
MKIYRIYNLFHVIEVLRKIPCLSWIRFYLNALQETWYVSKLTNVNET